MRQPAVTLSLAICLAHLATPMSSALATDDRVEVHGEEAYTYGDNESLLVAKDTSRMLAIRRAIESYSVFVQAASKVQDNQILVDLVQTISSGYLHDLQVEQRQANRTIHTKVRAYLVPSEINALLQSASNTRPNAGQTIPPGIRDRVSRRFNELPGLIKEAEEQSMHAARMVDRADKDADARSAKHWFDMSLVWLARHSNYLFEHMVAGGVLGQGTYEKFVLVYGPPVRTENLGNWSVSVWNVNTVSGASGTPATRGTMTVYFTQEGVAYDYRLEFNR